VDSFEKKIHILELHKWSKSHEEKDDEQGDENDENLQEEDFTITTIAITTSIPQQKQNRKLIIKQGDKQENHECVYTQLTLLVAQFPPNSIIGS
jgi:hypothetical protein